MELDEMKLAWQSLAQRLERQEVIQRQMVTSSQLEKARHGLRPLVLGQVIQMAFGLLVTGVVVAFWSTRLQITHLLVCGLLVQLCGMIFIAMSARALCLIHAIDYAAPVLAIQRQLADLRAWRVRVEAPVNVVLGCFIWILALWMNLAWYGIDIWSAGFARWALLSGASGLVIVLAIVWWMRRVGLGRRIEDHAAGNSVRNAEAMLAEIARFEQA